MRELSAGLRPTVTCKRNGEFVQMSVSSLVPGDLVFLRGGCNTPADVHWVKGDDLQLDTSALTGESRPVKRPLPRCTVTKVTTDDDGHDMYVDAVSLREAFSTFFCATVATDAKTSPHYSAREFFLSFMSRTKITD